MFSMVWTLTSIVVSSLCWWLVIHVLRGVLLVLWLLPGRRRLPGYWHQWHAFHAIGSMMNIIWRDSDCKVWGWPNEKDWVGSIQIVLGWPAEVFWRYQQLWGI